MLILNQIISESGYDDSRGKFEFGSEVITRRREYVGESMISEVTPMRVCLVCASTELRKSIDRLAVLVKREFPLDFFSIYCMMKLDKGS